MSAPVEALLATSGLAGSFLPHFENLEKIPETPAKTKTPPNVDSEDVKAQFKDPYGPRLGKSAPFWKTYVQEANQADDEQCKGWSHGLILSCLRMLDVILIFAALFSGICTAFIMDSLRYIRPNDSQTTNALLLTISQNLIAASNPSGASTSPTELPVFTPTKSAIAVNVLWIFSLMISLVVTLISILAKEWCHEYLTGRTGPAHEQARRRQQRYDGIRIWRMKGFVAFLPTLMHIALFLFMIGLSIHMWTIHHAVAAPVMTLTAIIVLLYLAATTLPFRYESCPYSTSLSRLVTGVWLRGTKQEEDLSDDNVPMDLVTSQALSWVISHCENSPSVDTALQAIAGADHSLPCEPLWNCDAVDLARQRLHTCFSSQGLPLTNSGFESLVKLGSGSAAFQLCVLYARVLNVLAWDGTKDGLHQSMCTFRNVWAEFELLYENLSKHSDSDVSASATVGYAGMSIWTQNRPYIISNFDKDSNSPLGVSSYILRVMVHQNEVSSYEAQVFELFYVLQRRLMDNNSNPTAYKHDLVRNLVSILDFLPCDRLLSDFGFASQVLATAGFILNGHHSGSGALTKRIGQYAQFDGIEPELLLFLGLVGLIEASESSEDASSIGLEVVFERLVQLKILLVSNTRGSWPPSDLRLPFVLGSSSTYRDYALQIVSQYYRRHHNTTVPERRRSVGLAGGLITASAMGDDCILDYWRPMVTHETAAPRWSSPSLDLSLLELAFFAVLSLMKAQPDDPGQHSCLVNCFHDIADKLQRQLDEPRMFDLLKAMVKANLLEALVRGLLVVRSDEIPPVVWRGVRGEPKLVWWGSRLAWFAQHVAHQRATSQDDGGISDGIEQFCQQTGSKPTLQGTLDQQGEFLVMFKSILMNEMLNPGIPQMGEKTEGSGPKRSWTSMFQRSRRKPNGSPTAYDALV